MAEKCEVAKERDDYWETLKDWRNAVRRLLSHSIRSSPIDGRSLMSLPATGEVSEILHELEDRLAGM